jgi:hypothetical protein
MHSSSITKIIAAFTLTLGTLPIALAEQRVAVKSDDLRDVFVTAGYAAAFGAATGVALLPFMSGSVSSNMRVVAGGASIGFLLGSAISIYNISTHIHAANNRTPYGVYPQEDETLYGIQEETENQPLSALPPRCKNPTGALVVGCGKNISMSWPDVQIAPQAISVPLVRVQF